MKVLLTAINAKYIHSNLAIHSIKAFAEQFGSHLVINEFTINNSLDDILKAIYKENPQVIAISTYIWNVEMVKELIIELEKVLPDRDIWLGGPEVSFESEEQLKAYPTIKGIIVGEGEGSFKELMAYYIKQDRPLEKIRGLVYHNDEGKRISTGQRPLLNISDIPFAYKEKIESFENKIIYYESSRGCPFSCQYCLSSLERQVRFRDIDLVRYELKQFINAKVKQVKFVDRTFNCNKNHAMKIWEYLKEEDNGVTNFHFEISADLIDDEMIEFLMTVRPGLFQFEIGVQSTHKETLDIIQRKMDFHKLSKVVKRLNESHNIHQHLDLIAGLPEEDFLTFKHSFNDVYGLEPEQLQLGFLKVLKGSGMHERSKAYGLVYHSKPPYEVLSTAVMSYDEVIKLKGIEEMVEIYHNSGQFTATLKYLNYFFDTPFDLFEALADYYEEMQLYTMQHARMARYDILLDFYNQTIEKEDIIIRSLLLFDLYLQENLKKRPIWFDEEAQFKEQIRVFYQEEKNIERFLKEYKEYSGKQINRMTHIEPFPVDILSFIQEGDRTFKKERTFVLFNYLRRDPLLHHATYDKVIF